MVGCKLNKTENNGLDVTAQVTYLPVRATQTSLWNLPPSLTIAAACSDDDGFVTLRSNLPAARAAACDCEDGCLESDDCTAASPVSSSFYTSPSSCTLTQFSIQFIYLCSMFFIFLALFSSVSHYLSWLFSLTQAASFHGVNTPSGSLPLYFFILYNTVLCIFVSLSLCNNSNRLTDTTTVS